MSPQLLSALSAILLAVPSTALANGATSTTGGGDWLITAESLLPERLETGRLIDETENRKLKERPIEIGERTCFGIFRCTAYAHFTEPWCSFDKKNLHGKNFGISFGQRAWGDLSTKDFSQKEIGSKRCESFHRKEYPLYSVVISKRVVWDGEKISLNEFYDRINARSGILLRQLDFDHLETLEQLRLWDGVLQALLVERRDTLLNRADERLVKRVAQEGFRLENLAKNSIDGDGHCDRDGFAEFRSEFNRWNHDGSCRTRDRIEETLGLTFPKTEETCDQEALKLTKLMIPIMTACTSSVDHVNNANLPPIEIRIEEQP